MVLMAWSKRIFGLRPQTYPQTHADTKSRPKNAPIFSKLVMVTTKKLSGMLKKSFDPKSRYTQIKELGEGSFGHVWLVRSNFSFRTYVKKEMNERCKDENEQNSALNEANILARLKHKNIIRYKDAYFVDGRLCIIMEYANDGDLYTKIKKQNGRKFDSNQILDWFVQLVMAVKYIHDQNILHRDLKSQNIFLTMMGILKVGDFGISRLLGCTSDHARTVVGTPYYLSPEICRREPYNQKSDMWSLGIILYEMTMLTYPFVGKTLSELVANILLGNFASVKSTSPLICDLILILLQLKASDRPSATDILCIPAVATITNNLMKKIIDADKNARKDSFSSPLIERKRDRSFKYDVIFDLTLNHNLNENSSNTCKKSIVHSDRCDASDANHYKPRSTIGDAKSDQHTLSPMLIETPSIPAITDKKIQASDSASILANVESVGETARPEIKQRSVIGRKRTFTLDRCAVDTDCNVKWRRSCDSPKGCEHVEDITVECYSGEIPVNNDPLHWQKSYILGKSSCNYANIADEVKKPWRVTSHDNMKSPGYVESVGPVTDFSNMRVRVAEKGSSSSERDLSYITESNRLASDDISMDSRNAVGSTFIISKLSPKIKAKVLGRARKSYSKNMEQVNRIFDEQNEKSNGLKEDSLPSSKEQREFLSSQNHPNQFDYAGEVKKSDKEYVTKHSRTRGSPTRIVKKDYKVESVAKDVLVFIDDEEFFPIEDKDSKDRFVPSGNCSDKSLIQQVSKQMESNWGKMRKNHERMERIKLMLESRVGENQLKILCSFLRKRKLALLEDDVLSYVNGVLGKERDNLLPMIIQLLLLEK